MPQTLRGYVFLFISLAILGYALFTGRNYLRGLSLSVTSPKDGTELKNPYITIEGIALRTNRLFVNGASVFPEKNGHFEFPLLIPPGYSIIYVKAEDRFGHSKLVRREVYYTFATSTTAD